MITGNWLTHSCGNMDLWILPWGLSAGCRSCGRLSTRQDISWCNLPSILWLLVGLPMALSVFVRAIESSGCWVTEPVSTGWTVVGSESIWGCAPLVSVFARCSQSFPCPIGIFWERISSASTNFNVFRLSKPFSRSSFITPFCTLFSKHNWISSSFVVRSGL